MNRLTGKKAPDFHIQAVSGDGEQFLELSLDSYRGHWLVLFFYPLDFTFVCPTEITAFSQAIEAFEQADAKILGVSTDSVYCHQAWIRSGLGAITYPLGADKTMSMAADYGVLLEDEGVALRGLFLIDPEQTVRYSVIHDNNVGRNTDEVLRVLKALQTGSLCGANWTIGSAPLSPEPSAPSVATDAPLSTEDPVKIYTQPGCSYCTKTKEFLGAHHIPYVEIDLSTDKEGQAFMDSRGYTALPVTVIGTDEISGFRLDKIETLLRQDSGVSANQEI